MHQLKTGFRLNFFSDYQPNSPYKLSALAIILDTRRLKVIRKQTSKQIRLIVNESRE